MTLKQVLTGALVCMMLVAVVAILFPFSQHSPFDPKKSPAAKMLGQLAIAAIAYGSDNNDRIPITANGWLCRMQDIPDRALTIDCPAAGTQNYPAENAAGARRTDAWPLILMPYTKSPTRYVDPVRHDRYNIFSTRPKSALEAGYDREQATYRNQNRFPMFGLTYMFLSPLRIRKELRGKVDAFNYAESESHTFAEAADPSGTVFFTQSQRTREDTDRGFFVVNAPGMWSAFNKKDGYIALSAGTPGSGSWAGDCDPTTEGRQKETGFVYDGEHDGCNAVFLDGHTKYYHDAALASGTDFLTSTAKSDPGSTLHITDKSHYLWNLSDKNFYGL